MYLLSLILVTEAFKNIVRHFFSRFIILAIRVANGPDIALMFEHEYLFDNGHLLSFSRKRIVNRANFSFTAFYDSGLRFLTCNRNFRMA